MAIFSRTCLPSRAALGRVAFVSFAFLAFGLSGAWAQTVIFNNPGTSYLNTDMVVTNTYPNVDISNCSSISFNVNFNFAFGWLGAGNMESNDECPFAPAPCDGDPDPALAETGSCANCWDFLYVRFIVDGVEVYTRLIGVPGDLVQTGAVTFGPFCTQNASNASIIVSAQTWAADENVTTSNITITCWDAMANPTANPDPACAGQPITLTGNLSNPASVGSVAWTGPGTITPPNQASATVTNAPIGNNTYTLTLTDDNNCTETATVSVDVNPGPTVTNPGPQPVCSGQLVDIMFSGTATDYNWTNSNPAIGLAASGTGDINFTAATVGSTTTATITVTPVSGPCTGTPVSFVITVSPGPTVNNIANVAQCAGSFVSVNFSGTPGATYTWDNDNTAIGLAATGTGNINFNSLLVTSQEVATITVTPSNAAGCEGTPRTFTITINPQAVAEDPGDLIFCSGDDIQIEFMGTGTNYNWTSTNSATGVPNSGMGNIDVTSPTFFGNNEVTTVNVTATGGCPGLATVFTITVRPTSQVSPVPNVSACSGEQITINFSSQPTGVSPTWTNSNPAIGLGITGTGNIMFNAAVVAAPVTGIVTVQSVLANCSGPAITFNITIGPGPTMNPVSNISVCAGEPIAATFTGAGAGAIYNWTNSNTAIGLPATGTGNFSVIAPTLATTQNATISVVPTVNGCIGQPRIFNVTVNAAPSMTAPANITLCAGEAGTVNFSGTAGANYNWTNSNTAIGLGAAGSGNIAFTVPSGLATVQSATVSVTPQLGTCNGTPVTFNILANVPPTLLVSNVQCAPNLLTYTVIVTSNATTLTASAGTVAASAGGYTISGIPAGTNVNLSATLTGCTSQSTVNAPNCNCPTVAAASDPNNPAICEGNTIPALTATAAAGLEMNWYAAPSGGMALATNTGTFTPAGPFAAGTFTFYVETRDPATGCVSTTRTPVTLTVNGTPTVDAPTDVFICAGAQISVNFTGSNGAVFNWTNNNANIGLPTSGSGNISVITSPTLATTETATISVAPQIGTCTGVAVPFAVTVNAGAAFSLGTVQCAPDLLTYSVQFTTTNSPNITTTAGTLSGSGNNFTITAIPAGTNITIGALTPAPALCASLQSVAAPNCNCPPLTPPTTPNNPDICASTALPALTVSVAAGLQVDWFATPIGGTALATNTTSFTPAGPFTPGVYTFYAETKDPVTGCTSTTRTAVVLTINAEPVMAPPSGVAVCAGMPIQVVFSGTAGASFAWTNNNTAIGIGASGTGNIAFTPPANLANSQTANFTVTPSLNGCSGNPVNFTAIANATPVITIDNVQCAPSLLTYTISVSVTNNANVTATAGLVTGSNGVFTIANINTGTNISISATSANCPSTQTVNSPNCNCPPVAAASTPSNPNICQGAPIPALTVTAAAGLQVDWYLQPSGGTAIVTNTTALTPPGGVFPPGTYTFYAETRDPATGCVSTTRTAVTLTVVSAPTLSVPNSPMVCADQNIIVNFSGTVGAVFNWTNNNTVIGLAGSGTGNIGFTVSPDIDMTEVANIQVTPVLGNCTGSPVNFTITANPLPTLDITLISCDASQTNYTIELESNANSLTSTAGTITNLGGGNFTVSNIPEGTNVVLLASGANNCNNIQSINSPNCNCPPVALPTGPNNPSICPGAAAVPLTVSVAAGLQVNWFANPTGGTALATNTTSFTPTINTNIPGTFTFYAESFDAVNGCASTARTAVTITVSAPPTASITGTNAICAGNQATLTASGGATYAWSVPGTGATINVSPILNTTYTVTVTNSQLCTNTATFSVVVNLPFNVTINATTCDPAEVGTQTLNLTTVQGCDSTVTINTTLNLANCAPDVSATATNVSCPGDADGSFTITASDGFAPFAFAWAGVGQSGNGQINTNGGNAIVDDLAVGTYTVTVTGTNGASATTTVTIGAPQAITITATAQVKPNGFGVSCAGKTDGVVNTTVTGGTSPYTYDWSSTATTANLTDLGVGTYTVTVTDDNGCTNTAQATVTEPAPFGLELSTSELECDDTTLGYTVSPLGGVGPFTYTLDGTSVSGPRIEVPKGNHVIILTDAAGCTADTAVTVTIPEPTTISLTAEQTIALGNPVTVEATTNATVWDNLMWTPLRDTTNADTLMQTWVPQNTETITVMLTDTAGCKVTATTRVIVNRNVQIFIPNIFDPKADDQNFIWKIFGGPSVDLLQKVHIFDRWGGSVYLWDEPIKLDLWPGWDGFVNNKPANPGVFVYYIKVKLVDGEEVLFSGDVTVLR
jgi:hypothetical protein